MEFYVPYQPDDPKSRLSEVMSQEERESFVRLMLADV
ncbi:MAG: 2-phospho-L-lactate guanylyltransferase, partial [Halobacteriota archaeon]